MRFPVRFAVAAAIGVSLVVSQVGQAVASQSAGPASSSVPPVTHVSAGSATPSTVQLSWRWPSAKSVVGVTIVMAKGAVAPTSPSKGHLVGRVARPAHTLTVRRLAALTRYAFAVFARDKLGHYSERATVTVVTSPPPLTIGTRSLASGIRGLYYLQVLSASGGVAPYTWTAAGLPSGLSMSGSGVMSGYPRSTGARTVTVRVRDARRTSRQGTLRLVVPTSLPAGCIARSCAQLSRNTYTIQVPAHDITSVSRSATSGQVTHVVLSGIKAGKGDTLVLAATTSIPSGLIATVNAVTASAGGSQTLAVSTVTPAAAYYQGIVQTVIPPAETSTPATVEAPAATKLSCKDGVTSDLHGLDVTPSLEPSIALDWKHRLFGSKGTYVGYGGLKLFQFALTGTITVDLGVSVSGKAKCTMNLPGLTRLVPVGDLGAVVLQLHPTLTLTTTAEVDVRASVTLSCYAGYRWDQGTSNTAAFCTATRKPLGLSPASGLDATVTGTIEAGASLDDLPGVKGTVDASLHAGYHPGQSPVAEIDAESDYDLKATLANIWKGAPNVTLVHGTIFRKVLATWGSAPPGVNGAPSITVSPAEAFPWSDAVCGYDIPTFGSNAFTVQGSGFAPGESAGLSTGWTTYPGDSTVSPDGAFSVTEAVGEVPSVFNQYFAVSASGSSGSEATSTIELDSDGCIDQSDSGGNIDLQWGGNGFDPDSTVTLTIDGDSISSATTDGLGSGGSTAAFACPGSGSYTWEVSGTVNGQGVAATANMDCATAAAAGRSGHTAARGAAASAAA